MASPNTRASVAFIIVRHDYPSPPPTGTLPTSLCPPHASFLPSHCLQCPSLYVGKPHVAAPLSLSHTSLLLKWATRRCPWNEPQVGAPEMSHTSVLQKWATRHCLWTEPHVSVLFLLYQFADATSMFILWKWYRAMLSQSMLKLCYWLKYFQCHRRPAMHLQLYQNMQNSLEILMYYVSINTLCFINL